MFSNLDPECPFCSHLSALAWRIPEMGEPGGLPSLGSHSRTRLKRLSSSSRISCCLLRSYLADFRAHWKVCFFLDYHHHFYSKRERVSFLFLNFLVLLLKLFFLSLYFSLSLSHFLIAWLQVLLHLNSRELSKF